MSRITDDILNDYIDNELNSSSIDELKNNLSNDEEAVKKLKALKISGSLQFHRKGNE